MESATPDADSGPTIKQILRSEGRRVTVQRTLLLRIIRESGGHLDADEIHRQARQHDPRISLSTVYRTLNLLKDLDLVEEFHFDEEHHHYEMAAQTHHHHLVCTECGQITEFQSPLLERLRAEIEREHGFVLERLQMDALGRCQECQAAGNGT
jgi:Fur family ferric uptake transcriptional regulator